MGTRLVGSGRRPGLVAGCLAFSWLTMLGHNLWELPLAVTDIENTGPLLVAGALLGWYWLRPASPAVHLSILVWALLNLVVGGILSVLPLPILPFEPEQSLSHYVTHLVYAVGQVPLMIVSIAALRRPHDQADRG